jgi:hypothetical protein
MSLSVFFDYLLVDYLSVLLVYVDELPITPVNPSGRFAALHTETFAIVPLKLLSLASRLFFFWGL